MLDKSKYWAEWSQTAESGSVLLYKQHDDESGLHFSVFLFDIHTSFKGKLEQRWTLTCRYSSQKNPLRMRWRAEDHRDRLHIIGTFRDNNVELTLKSSSNQYISYLCWVTFHFTTKVLHKDKISKGVFESCPFFLGHFHYNCVNAADVLMMTLQVENRSYAGRIFFLPHPCCVPPNGLWAVAICWAWVTHSRFFCLSCML